MLRFVSGIAVFLLASFWVAIFVFINYDEPRIHPLPFVRLVWYFPVLFAFLGAYFLIVGAMKSK